MVALLEAFSLSYARFSKELRAINCSSLARVRGGGGNEKILAESHEGTEEKTRKDYVNHRDLHNFFKFSQHPAWVFTLVN